MSGKMKVKSIIMIDLSLVLKEICIIKLIVHFSIKNENFNKKYFYINFDPHFITKPNFTSFDLD